MSNRNKAQKAAPETPAVEPTPIAGIGPVVENPVGEAGAPKEEGLEQSGDAETSSEVTPTAEEPSVVSLAAEGLRDGSALSDEEVQRVSGAVLSAGGDEPDAVNVEALVAVLTQRVEEMAVLIFKLERKVADLEDKLYGIAKDAKLKVKDGESLHGKVDDLRI